MRKYPINRYAPIYKEIEKFRDFELINCVAFEMAIRNDEAKELLVQVSLLPIEFYEDERAEPEVHPLIDLAEQKLKEKFLIDWEGVSYIKRNVIEYKKRRYIYKEYENIKYTYQERFHNNIAKAYGFSTIEEMKERAYEEKIHIIHYLPLIGRKIRDNTISLDDTTSDDTTLNTITLNARTSYAAGTLSTISCISPKTLSYEEEKKNTAILDMLQTVDRTPKVKYENYFSRPELVKTKDSDFTLPVINLFLPEEELIAYIKNIKRELRDIIKLPLELVDNTTEKIEDKKITNKALKYSDMFFIYDAYKEKMKQTDMIQSLINYHYYEYNKKTNFDNKTVTKYYSEAKEYIDNLKYKELITGIKEK